jgi:hypothetical protein
MIVCDLCLFYIRETDCRIGLKIPKGMTCREFSPGLTRFCSNPTDFVDSKQVVQMATYFGMKGPELKKVQMMAAKEERDRITIAAESRLAANGTILGTGTE